MSFLFALLRASSGFAATWYISTTGTDTNSGTAAAPVATIMKAQSLASAGDTVVIESGTYMVPNILNSLQSGVYEVVNLVNKSGITYEAAAGARPVLNFSGINPTGYRVAAFWVTASNVTFQGFDVTGVQENITDSNNQSLAFAVWGCSNCTWNQVNAYSNEGVGFYLEQDSPNNYFYRCDSYNNYGINSYSYGNADGFGCHPATGGTNNIYRECRSWNNSDDGYDCIQAHESVTFDHCWSYKNGNNGGNGNGFKVGGWGSTDQDQIPDPVPVHTVVYCLSADNVGNGGYYANHQPGQSANWWHNSSYGNATNFNMLERTPPIYSSTTDQTDSNDVSGVNENMHYNVAYGATYTNLENLNESGTSVSSNSWTEPITLSNSDFQSLVESQMTAPRQADGSLPVLTFMVPTASSPAANLGCFIPAPTLTWTGATSSAWNIGTANWINTTGSADVYCDTAAVNFTDTSSTASVVIAAAVNPGSVTFSNSTQSYTINSTSAGISGSTSVLKSGTGEVLWTGTQSFTGGTTINGGIDALGADSSTTAATVESPGLTGGSNASLGSGGVIVAGGGELRFGGRGGATVYTYVTSNPITISGGSIYSVDAQQELAGGLTVNSGGASLFTSWATKNLWIHGAWAGSGNVVIDNWQPNTGDTSGGYVLVDSAANPYNGIITINGPSTGYLGGILQIGNVTALANATIVNNNTSGLLFTVTSPQIGALGGSGSFTLPSGSLNIGANGASTNYSGALSGAGGLTKSGSGAMTLSGSCNYTGPTSVTSGILEITGSVTNSSSANISSGAVLFLAGGRLSVTGSLSNAGIAKFSGSASLTLSGTFTNTGVLDLINGPQTLPIHFINQGVVLYSSAVRVQQESLSSSNHFSLTIQGYSQHTYQLQHTASLTPPIAWTNVGALQTGAGAPLVFTDTSATGVQGFYRVQASP